MREASGEVAYEPQAAGGASMGEAPTAPGQERPTATVERVDVSSRRRASAAPADPEGLLFKAYGSLEPGQSGVFRVTDLRSEPCVCGGKLVRNRGQSVYSVVRNHNETTLHQAWRAWREAAA